MRYLKILFSFARYGLIASMEFRFNFLIWAFLSLLWATLFIYSTELIFGQINSIAGWTKDEALILVAVLTLFVGLMWITIFPNLNKFSIYIRKGQLDFYLARPLNSRFLVSSQVFEFDQFLRIIVVSSFIVFKLQSMNVQVDFVDIFGFIISLLMGLIVFYNIFFSLTITNFWLVNVSNLEDFFHTLLDIGKFPIQIYKGIWGFILSYILPVLFISTLPVQFLLNKGNPNMLLVGLILVIVTSLFSQWFWNFALKRYSSASS